MKMLPHELDRAVRYAKLRTGAYIRSEIKKNFAAYTGVKAQRAKKRRFGSKARGWAGGNSVPIRDIKGKVYIRKGQVEYWKRKSGEKKQRVDTRAGWRKRQREKTSYKQTVQKVFIDGVWVPEYFLDKWNRVVTRVGEGENAKIVPVMQEIWQETFEMRDAIVPGVREKLTENFLNRANHVIETTKNYKSTSTHKGQVEDRLAGIRFFRTNIR